MNAPVVYVDHNRHTCIQYGITGDDQQRTVHVIYMESPELRLGQEEYTKFHRHWSQIIGCDPKEAARKYLTGHIPFSHEVKSILENIMNENETANANTNPVEEAVAKKKAAAPKKADPKKPSTPKVTDGEGKAKAKAKAKADAEGEKKVDAFFKKAQDNMKKKAAAEEQAKGKGKGKDKPAGKKTEGEKKARTPKVDLTGKFIHFLKGIEGKKFQEGSVRSQCFALIKDGMAVKDYLKAVARKQICEEPMAIDCLKKLSDPEQKVPAISLKDK